MSFGPKKGSPKVPGSGRIKGVPNKMTRDVKEMILAALDKAGGAEYLHRQAFENPGPFMALLGRVLPKQIVGDADNPVRVEMSVAEARAKAIEELNKAFAEPAQTDK